MSPLGRSGGSLFSGHKAEKRLIYKLIRELFCMQSSNILFGLHRAVWRLMDLCLDETFKCWGEEAFYELVHCLRIIRI